MGQREVQSYLKKLRLSGDHDFKTANSIIRGLAGEGLTNGSLRSVRLNLVKLSAYGFVESKINSKSGEWKRVWRLKKIYL